MPLPTSIPRTLVIGAFALLASCGGAPARSPVAPPAPPLSPTPKFEAGGASDASSNTIRDRRGEPGVRAAPKSLVVGKPSSVKCGKLAKSTRDVERMDLLAGRLRVRPPPSSKVPEPLADAPPLEEESRIVADGNISLAIVARETFQLDPDLYEAEASAPSKPGTLDVEAPKFLRATFPNDERLEIVPVEIGAGESKMRAYAARPPHPNAPPGRDTALVLALLVAHDDGVLESVGFYVRGEPVRSAVGSDLVGCTRLAERVASTLVPGPRKLERVAGARRVLELSSGDALTMNVPADYVVIRSKDAARLVKLRPISLYAGSISVSLTDAVTSPEGADERLQGTLLGRPTEWRGKTAQAGGFFFASAPIEGEQGKSAAVLVKATRQAKALDEMRAVAETLAVSKSGAP